MHGRTLSLAVGGSKRTRFPDFAQVFARLERESGQTEYTLWFSSDAAPSNAAAGEIKNVIEHEHLAPDAADQRSKTETVASQTQHETLAEYPRVLIAKLRNSGGLAPNVSHLAGRIWSRVSGTRRP